MHLLRYLTDVFSSIILSVSMSAFCFAAMQCCFYVAFILSFLSLPTITDPQPLYLTIIYSQFFFYNIYYISYLFIFYIYYIVYIYYISLINYINGIHNSFIYVLVITLCMISYTIALPNTPTFNSISLPVQYPIGDVNSGRYELYANNAFDLW